MNTPLIIYINTERKRLAWSIRELGRRAGISHGALSNILRQKSIPGTTTVEKIADALGTDRAYLLQLLAESRSYAVFNTNIDPGAAYIARRLSELPDDIRALAIDAVGLHVDNIYDIIQRRPVVKEEPQQAE